MNWFFSLKNKKTFFVLILLILLAGTVRIVPLLTYSPDKDPRKLVIFTGDALWYHKMGVLIADQGLIGLLDKTNEIFQNETLPAITGFRTPIYPFFIAQIYKVFGQNPLIVMEIQILIDLGTLILIFAITQALFKKNVISLIASGLYALSPLAIMFTDTLHADGLITFCFALLIWLVVVTLQNKKIWNYILLGVLLGIGSLIKPVFIYFFAIIIFIIFLHAGSIRLTWKKSALHALLIVIFFLLTIAPWQLRNLYVFGHYSLTYQQGRELLVWRVATCQAWNEHKNLRQAWDSVQRPYLKIADPFVRSQVEGKAAVNFILQHKAMFAGCMMRGVKNFFYTKALFVPGTPGTHPYEYGSRGITNAFMRETHLSRNTFMQLSYVYTAVLFMEYILMIIAVVYMIVKKEQRIFAVFSVVSILYFALLAGIDGYSRYRYPLTPLIAILSAYGLWILYEWICNKWFIKREQELVR